MTRLAKISAGYICVFLDNHLITGKTASTIPSRFFIKTEEKINALDSPKVDQG